MLVGGHQLKLKILSSPEEESTDALGVWQNNAWLVVVRNQFTSLHYPPLIPVTEASGKH